MSDVPEEQPRAIFMSGNLSEGYLPYGPFESFDEAFEFADEHNLQGWAMQLFPPKRRDDLGEYASKSFSV